MPAVNAPTHAHVQEPQLKKLGFREKAEYTALEGEIEGLTEQHGDIEARLAAAAQAGDFEHVQALSEELADIAAALDDKSDRWLALAERAEAVGTV